MVTLWLIVGAHLQASGHKKWGEQGHPLLASNRDATLAVVGCGLR